MLTSFQPDEFAVDPIAPEVLRVLQEEDARRLPHMRPTLTDLSAAYRPPPDDVLISRVRACLRGA